MSWGPPGPPGQEVQSDRAGIRPGPAPPHQHQALPLRVHPPSVHSLRKQPVLTHCVHSPAPGRPGAVNAAWLLPPGPRHMQGEPARGVCECRWHRMPPSPLDASTPALESAPASTLGWCWAAVGRSMTRTGCPHPCHSGWRGGPARSKDTVRRARVARGHRGCLHPSRPHSQALQAPSPGQDPGE